MKSNVESRSTCRVRSDRKMAAPLRTPTKITDCPAKSLVICAPSSLTRFAISCRGISTLSSLMAFHIKLGGPIRVKVLNIRRPVISIHVQEHHPQFFEGECFEENAEW